MVGVAASDQAGIGPVEATASFGERLSAAMRRAGSLVCVGLDPDPARFPSHLGAADGAAAILRFNAAIVEATHDLVCAYKSNFAFYERFGAAGLRALEETVSLIPDQIPTIGDAKRGDIANTSRAYADAVFDAFGFDSVTVSPYMGLESLQPFLEREGKGVWVLCRTSNPSASEFQSSVLGGAGSEEPLFLRVARAVAQTSCAATLGLVVGATSGQDLELVRGVAPKAPLLVPGVGSQGGDLEAAVRAHGPAPVVINASRSILYPDGAVGSPDRIRSAALEMLHRMRAAA